ncbi:centrosomal protein of 152 kDa-like isoform X1 [Amphibalanus amphitrite]|uniref:centrosomal protein of 152 kDa-like isoform X1 n=1 Tax=Amphibalanus amphitrite TaxID=1232801 RepID=UPI001C905036|nr:centrosomal protein of 152 kDa-like isoform X1 [Amphibalanus amphitrite]
MDLPGSSLFNGGSIHFDGLSIEAGASGEPDEEAEAAEEEERRNQELQNVLKDAFDDLIDDDEDEDATMSHTDPSFHPEQYPTSTPFIAGKERSLYDELGGQYNLPRMSDPGPAYNLGSDGDYHGNPGGDYHRDDPAGDYHGDPGGGYPGAGYHSGGEYEPAGRDDEPLGFQTLQPEETNAGLTEMVNTPRQHLDTSDSSAAHYRHCYTSPRSELAAAAADDGSGDADDLSSGNMIEMGLRAHQEPGGWPGGGRALPEPAARTEPAGDLLDPGKYVANKQKDYILARTSRDQLETLYEARGHEIGRLRSELDRLKADSAAELRATRHQAALAAADGQGLQTSLQQAQNLLVEKEDELTKLRGEIDSLKIQLKATEDAKKESTSRLQAAEVTVQSLQAELTELRRSETLSRSAERHQQLVDGLQRRHAEELAAQQRRMDALSVQLQTQTDAAATLRAQLADSEQARHRLAADKGDVINQMAAGLEAAQARCRQLMQAEPAQLRERLAEEERQREQLQLQLAAAQDQVSSLQRDLEACEAVLRLGGRDDTTADSSAPLAGPAHSTPVSKPSAAGSTEPSPFSLRRELMRAMENSRARREEVARLRTELEGTRDQLRTATAQLTEKDAQLTEKDAQLTAARDQAKQVQQPADQQAQQQQQRRLDELGLRLATEQKQRKLLEDQLRKIKAEGEKVHKTAEELRRHMTEQMEQADRDKLEAVEHVRATCLQLHDDMIEKVRAEKMEEYETELDALRTELSKAQEELTEVKELYVKVCQEKDQLEQDATAASQTAEAERNHAVKSALNQHYDRWYADWKRDQERAIAEAVDAERRQHHREVASGGTQTEEAAAPARPALSAHGTQTSPPPLTRDDAVQADDIQLAAEQDKLKKRLKRACLDKKKLQTEAEHLQQQMKKVADDYEERIRKERLEAERKVREARRRPSGSSDSDLVKTLRQELEDAHTRLRKLAEQTCTEKDELIVAYESRLREAVEQDRRKAAALATAQRRHETADQLRDELERLRVEHETLLRQNEDNYKQGLASYRQLVENKVAELTKIEEELRRESAAASQSLREENARLTAQTAALEESYDNLLAQRQQDRENFERQIQQLTAESASGDRERLAELESRLQKADAESDQLRDSLRQSREKLRNYHGYVKEREQHYDGEFRRLEAEYRVAVGKMKEKVMLAREGAARARPPAAAAATQTDVSGEELARVLQEISVFHRTWGQLRLEVTQALQRCTLPDAGRTKQSAPPPPAAEPSTFRSHTAERRLEPDRGPPTAGGWSDSGRLSSLGRPDSGAGGGLSARGVSPLLGGDNQQATMERIRRDLNFIFHRETTAAAGGGGGSRGGLHSSAEEVLARLARLTPPSRDGGWMN